MAVVRFLILLFLVTFTRSLSDLLAVSDLLGRSGGTSSCSHVLFNSVNDVRVTVDRSGSRWTFVFDLIGGGYTFADFATALHFVEIASLFVALAGPCESPGGHSVALLAILARILCRR